MKPILLLSRFDVLISSVLAVIVLSGSIVAASVAPLMADGMVPPACRQWRRVAPVFPAAATVQATASNPLQSVAVGGWVFGQRLDAGPGNDALRQPNAGCLATRVTGWSAMRIRFVPRSWEYRSADLSGVCRPWIAPDCLWRVRET